MPQAPLYILARISSQKGKHVPRSTWSLQDAKNKFSRVVDAAREAPQTVTKHGKPAVVVLDADEYERLRRSERAAAPTFTDHLLAMPRDGGTFERIRGRLRKTGF
jgi:antitoxin Phd